MSNKNKQITKDAVSFDLKENYFASKSVDALSLSKKQTCDYMWLVTAIDEVSHLLIQFIIWQGNVDLGSEFLFDDKFLQVFNVLNRKKFIGMSAPYLIFFS